MPEPTYTTPLWPLAAYLAAVLVLVCIMVGMSYVLGQRHKDRATGEPYEGGILATGSARIRISNRFYLIAMFFVIFDLEAVFIVAWALVLRDAGWIGYLEILGFIGVLGLTLAYLWRQGALDQAPAGKQSGDSISNADPTGAQ